MTERRARSRKRPAKPIARNRQATARAMEGKERGARRCKDGVPFGMTALEPWLSATMVRAGNFSTSPQAAGEKYTGLYTLSSKNGFN